MKIKSFHAVRWGLAALLVLSTLVYAQGLKPIQLPKDWRRQLRQERNFAGLFYLHSKLARVQDFFQVAFVKFLAVFVCFEQMLGQFLFVALDDEFEFVEVT